MAEARIATAADRAWLDTVRGEAMHRSSWTTALFRLAHDQVVPGGTPGLDGVSPGELTPERLERLRLETLSGGYTPSPLRRFLLKKGEKEREIGVPGLVDQVVMAALRMLIEPVLEARLHRHVWGFRRGHDRFAAVATLGEVTVQRGVLLRADVANMFPSLDHGYLQAAVRQVWPETLVVELVQRWLRVWQPGVGVPMGTSISPVLSNAYLHVGLDRWLAAGSGAVQAPAPTVPWRPDRRWPQKVDGRTLVGRGTGAGWGAPPKQRGERVLRVVRYADDFAMLIEGDGRESLAALERVLAEGRLRLNPTKTGIFRVGGVEGWPVVVLGIPVDARRDGTGFRLCGRVSELEATPS